VLKLEFVYIRPFIYYFFHEPQNIRTSLCDSNALSNKRLMNCLFNKSKTNLKSTLLKIELKKKKKKKKNTHTTLIREFIEYCIFLLLDMVIAFFLALGL